MAAKQTNDVVFVGLYSKQRVQVDAGSNETIGEVTERMEARLQVPRKSLRLLHQGAPVERHTVVKDAFKELQTATVVHLVPVDSRPQLSLSARSRDANISNLFGDEKIIIYCKTCHNLCEGRPTLMCSACQSFSFERKDTNPCTIDQLYQSSPSFFGDCHDCKAKNVKATLMYECKATAESSHTGAFLKDLRHNTKGVSCMKCGNVRENKPVYVFNCSERHVMCLMCFEGFCHFNLNHSMFKNYPDAGFSIACPASNCNRVPVLDPHHFYAAGEEFYAKYSEQAFTDYKNGSVCMDCNYAIDYSVVERAPPTPEPHEGVSSAWYSGILRWLRGNPQPAPPPPPKNRVKVKCSRGCDRAYCSGCHAIWHEGECASFSDSTDFPIDERWMERSTWIQ